MFVYATGGVACAIAVCVPLLAHGEGQPDTKPPAVSLEYMATPDCPDANAFKNIITARLGYEAFREDATDRVLVNIAQRSGAVEGRIEWRDTKERWVGDRTFRSTSEDCRELVRPMAFALALQIQFLAAAGTSPESSPPSPPTPPPVSKPPSSGENKNNPVSMNATGPPSRGPGPEVAIGAGALVAFGVASNPVPFGRMWAQLAWRHRSLEVATEIGWPTTTRRLNEAGFSQQHLLASLAGCQNLRWLGVCLVAKGGAIRVVGKGVSDPASPWGRVFETGLRLAAVQRLGRHGYVAAQGEGLINVTHWRVTLDQKQVWGSPRFAATLGIDVGVRFP